MSKDVPLGFHYVYTLAYPGSMGGYVFYVGKGTRKRINHHEWEARNGVRSHKCNVIRKIHTQCEQVVKTILAYFETHEEALLYEIALIFFMDGLTNLTDGGEGTVGVARSEEYRRKVSDAHKGRIKTEEECHKISKALKGRTAHNKGKSTSEETRRKQSEAKKGKAPSPQAMLLAHEASRGRIKTEEERRKLSEALKGHAVSENVRRKVSEASRGRKHTEDELRKISEASKRTSNIEHLRKLSEANKGKSPSEETRRKLSEAAKQRWTQKHALEALQSKNGEQV